MELAEGEPQGEGGGRWRGERIVRRGEVKEGVVAEGVVAEGVVTEGVVTTVGSGGGVEVEEGGRGGVGDGVKAVTTEGAGGFEGVSDGGFAVDDGMCVNVGGLGFFSCVGDPSDGVVFLLILGVRSFVSLLDVMLEAVMLEAAQLSSLLLSLLLIFNSFSPSVLISTFSNPSVTSATLSSVPLFVFDSYFSSGARI
jgi:hypothetical protein